MIKLILLIILISHTNCDLNIFESDKKFTFFDSDFYHDDNDKLYLFSKVSIFKRRAPFSLNLISMIYLILIFERIQFVRNQTIVK